LLGDARVGLVSILLARGQYLGRIADFERAAELAEQAVTAQPAAASAHVARASVRSTFHRFDDALADVDEAARLGAPEAQLDPLRATIAQALGRYEDALVIRQRISLAQQDLTSLGSEAVLLTERGDESRHDFDDAERLFTKAQAQFRDVSAFPLAWLWLQQAVMDEKVGRTARAREWLEAARERAPVYAHVVSHLAALEGPRRAAELLRPLLATSDDPEIAAQLATSLAALGEKDDAERMRQQAAARYRELIERHPAAFADHAARFWLGAGADPKLAFDLARRNVETRKTDAAYELLIEAALAAGEPGAACDAADAAFGQHGWEPSTLLRTFATTAYAACGRAGRAVPNDRERKNRESSSSF
jgi:tetratricopeptide (TPR) repeat protein